MDSPASRGFFLCLKYDFSEAAIPSARPIAGNGKRASETGTEGSDEGVGSKIT